MRRGLPLSTRIVCISPTVVCLSLDSIPMGQKCNVMGPALFQRKHYVKKEPYKGLSISNDS